MITASIYGQQCEPFEQYILSEVHEAIKFRQLWIFSIEVANFEGKFCLFSLFYLIVEVYAEPGEGLYVQLFPAPI